MSQAIRFLTVDEVVAEQELQLANYGGGNAGILDYGKLNAAVGLPAATFGGEFLLDGIKGKASGYLTYLVRDHVFEQANKRIGLAAALIFLAVNGLKVTADNASVIDLVLTMASTGSEREEVEAFFDAHTEPCSAMALSEASDWMHSVYAPAFRKLAE